MDAPRFQRIGIGTPGISIELLLERLLNLVAH